jgi:UDP-glucose 4-epimerase
VPGAIAFASSAGAIYAGTRDAIITEHTAPAPTTAYAREKLMQEGLLAAFALAHPRMTALNARISTIYGPGQATVKQQGLLTHIARCILRNQPIQIYVPYDTIRDYIAVDDAASAITRALFLANQQPGVCTKIIASEKPTTIAEIISVFKRIARRGPLIVTSASKLTSLYARRVQFRSVVLTDGARPMVTSLAVGIAQLMVAERAAFVRSSPK